MPDLAWIEGEICPLAEAKVSFWDHGYFYGYGVYEACKVLQGKIYALKEHMDRLQRSLDALGIKPAQSREDLEEGMRALVRRSGYSSALVYLQITKGAGLRSHVLQSPKPVVTMFAVEMGDMPQEVLEQGAKALSLPDERWAHPHIKTLNLLPNILAKEKAEAQGAAEAIFYNRQGLVTEAASSNVFAVLADGRIVTAPTDGKILAGVTRLLLLQRAKEQGIFVEETYFTLDEMRRGREVWLTSTGPEIMAVTNLDGNPVGGGQPGPWAKKFYDLFLNDVENMLS